MNEVAVLIIRDYVDKFLFEPAKSWGSYPFSERAYSRWAACELMDRIGRSCVLSPAEVVENFIDEMDDMCDVSVKRTPNLLFTVARETGKDILHLFL